MADPVGTFSGLNSGIQWRDMVDQIMSIEAQRRYNPVAARQSALKSRADAWSQFQSVAGKFRDAAAALQRSTAFDVFTATAAKSPTTSRDLVSVSAGTGAAPGSYGVEVLATARAEKLGGAAVASSTAALGVAGSFALNGRAVTVTAGDTLVTLRDKINAANGGSTPSGVSATILASNGGSRLVLTSAATGATGIEATDAGNGTLQALGFSDGTTFTNIAANGSAQSHRLSSATAAAAALIGVSAPAAATIKAAGQVISVDLSVDSLESIAARINTATGNATAARVQSETVAGRTYFRLHTDAAIEVDASVSASDSANALAALGFTRGGKSNVAQSIISANTFVDAATGLAATTAALATDLQVNGQSLGITAGDTISLGGFRGDGTAVTRTLAVGAGTTVQDVLDALNEASASFGAGSRTATASLIGGRIALADNTAGDSQLALQLTVTHAGGSAISLGAFAAANGGTVGVSRQITAGADAVVRVDGQVVRRSSNVITDAISGVTITALGAEAGTSVQVAVDHNTDAITKSFQDFVAAYNAVRSFVTSNGAAKGPLAGSGALRSMSSSITTQLLQSVTGVTGSFTTASMAGLEHDRNGVLSLNQTTFKAALSTNFEDVRRLFSLTGTTTDSELSFVTAGDATQPTTVPYAVNITQAATVASVTGTSWTTYATTGAPDTLTLNDAATGISGSIAMADGDTIALTVQKLNAMFAANKMHLQAERTVGDEVRIASSDFGTTGGFTVSYTPGAGGDGTALLGIAAQAYAGLDVAGTIGGKAATGKGQLLTGDKTFPAEGLTVQFTGSAARAAGTVALSLGVGGALARVAKSLAADSSGGAGAQSDAAQSQADGLNARLSDIQDQLDKRRTALIRQFIAMESALAKAQSIGGALSAQLSSLGNRNS